MGISRTWPVGVGMLYGSKDAFFHTHSPVVGWGSFKTLCLSCETIPGILGTASLGYMVTSSNMKFHGFPSIFTIYNVSLKTGNQPSPSVQYGT